MIQVNALHLKQGDFELNNIQFEVPDGNYAMLMGQTGCGKTSVLEAICGLRPITKGQILLGGIDVTQLKCAERGIGYVPQDGALFSTMTVRQQLGFGLTIRKLPQKQIDDRVNELGSLLNINHLMDRKPKKLSGGETQRVALGRALAIKPAVLMMDEPLSALDDHTRKEMYTLLKSVQRTTGVTTLHVTHSRNETEQLADQLFVLNNGKITESNLNQN